MLVLGLSIAILETSFFRPYAKYFHGLSLLCMFAFTFQFCLLSLLKERDRDNNSMANACWNALQKVLTFAIFWYFAKITRAPGVFFFLKLKIQNVDPKQHLFGKEHNVEVATPSNI